MSRTFRACSLPLQCDAPRLFVPQKFAYLTCFLFFPLLVLTFERLIIQYYDQISIITDELKGYIILPILYGTSYLFARLFRYMAHDA
ncbi:hypothetical protein F5Y11DRAFT_332847 [Daldinia sp. FL1419]|nr:hypothetical protein F5Y11DRAFT_332847 [Daldinia sp. FL1419]